MTKRPIRIYTRTGDEGSTGLADGNRVGKSSQRIDTLGTIDELNALIGVLNTRVEDEIHRDLLFRLQHVLFDLGGELAYPGKEVLTQAQVEKLESFIDEIDRNLPTLREFVLPGGNDSAAHCHHARAVCRRAERNLVELAAGEFVNPHSLSFLNRLSDLFFVLARALAHENAGEELRWQREQL